LAWGGRRPEQGGAQAKDAEHAKQNPVHLQAGGVLTVSSGASVSFQYAQGWHE